MNGTLVSDLRQSLNFTDAKGIVIPVVILAIMAMLVIPLPSVALDILFTFNIMAGLVIVMISINVHKPWSSLHFLSFTFSDSAEIKSKCGVDSSRSNKGT